MRRAASMLLAGGLSAVAVLSTSTTAFAATPGVPTHAWMVKSGNTLSLIGSHVHRSYEQLAAFNHIPDPNLIFVGDVVRIPPAGYRAPVVEHTARLPAPVDPEVQTVPTVTVTQSVAYTVPAAPSSFQSCVIYQESRGDPQAQSPSSSASGLYGFLDGTWESVTGLPGPARDYSVAQQTAAFQKLYAEEGAAPWAAWDGC